MNQKMKTQSLVGCGRRLPYQRGVALLIGLMMLGMISLVAAFTAKSSSLTEKISSNTRTSAMAMQSAEAALRWCEKAVQNQVTVDKDHTLTVAINDPYSQTDVRLSAAPKPAVGAAYFYESYANWNSSSIANIKVLTAAEVGVAATGTFAVYKRMPECMAQATGSNTYVITARGFGPEVEKADDDRTPPKGAEIWLQSFISFN